MSFWMRLAAILRVFCFLSKFSKLYSKRVNQRVACVPGLTEKYVNTDPETYNFEKANETKSKQDLIGIDCAERELNENISNVPVPAAGDDSHGVDESNNIIEIVRSKDRSVHKVIELFDKPNEIETSLPRYQNKTPQIINKRTGSDERPKPLPEKLEQLKEELERKLSIRLENSPCERNFPVPAIENDNQLRPNCGARGLPMLMMNNTTEESTTHLEVESKSVSDTSKPEEIENITKIVISNHQKLEKEKQNCLLKVNLSNFDPSMMTNNLIHSEKRFDLGKRKYYKPLTEMDYFDRLAKKNERTVVEYGGGWDCHRCGERVYHAERMLACGNAYHKTCFSCCNCRKLLGPRTYFEANMEIYCSQCHAKKCGLIGYGYGLGPGVLQTSP